MKQKLNFENNILVSKRRRLCLISYLLSIFFILCENVPYLFLASSVFRNFVLQDKCSVSIANSKVCSKGPST